LQLKSPFLANVCESVVGLMGGVYPELVDAQSFLYQVVRGEEERFADTLDHGLKLLAEELDRLRAKKGAVLPGEVAFKLYDTYGFPLDLVQDALKEEGLALDYAGYEAHMQAQREASRAAWRGGAGGEIPQVYQELAEWEPTQFLGYDALEADSVVLAIISQQAAGDQALAGEEVELVTAATPFYGEAGGQMGDAGEITGDGWRVTVSNTQRLPNDLIVHQGVVEEGVVKVNDPAQLKVDVARRGRIARHHTATHLLQAVLRQHLGEHVKQSGSLVAPERLRFDFTHFKAISADELNRMELDLNAQVAANLPVHTDRMTVTQALARGATALFEEKYGDQVRVVAIPEVSQELCGGTHVERTGDLGLVKIVSEASVAAGIRRIEAVCGPDAVALMQSQAQELDQAAALLKGSRADVLSRLDKLLKRQKELEKEVEALKGRLAAAQAADYLVQAREVNGIQALALEVEAGDPKALREFAAKLLDRMRSGVVVLGAKAAGKAMLVALVSKDLTKRIAAGELIKALAPQVGGSGGGRADMAQAGGPDAANLPAALAQTYDLIAQKTQAQ
jgi:alanyl-tRNA synthetase